MDEKIKFMIGKEIDLLKNYPKIKRNLLERAENKSEIDRSIARRFDKDFFDGDRRHGYGGFSYHPKFWQPVIPTFKEYWNLNNKNSVLDVGCGKGFMLWDFMQCIPGIKVRGIDISKYAIENSHDKVRNFLTVGNANNLPFDDKSFDVVISINTIHNLDTEGCAKALKEISRVSKKYSFVTVDAYRNEQEKISMLDWNLTAKTIMSVDQWKIFFNDNNYHGDFFWFFP